MICRYKYIVFFHMYVENFWIILDPCIPVGIHAKYAPAALVECGIRAPWPWNIGSLGDAEKPCSEQRASASYPSTNPSAKVQLSAMIKIVTEVLFRSTWRFLRGDFLRKQMVQDEWEEAGRQENVLVSLSHRFIQNMM